jgi:Domain of unknown function (DUF6471)
MAHLSEAEWKKRASNLLKAELKKRNVGYAELSNRLQEIGLSETVASITTKINRGTFSFSFFLQCMKVVEVNIIHLAY